MQEAKLAEEQAHDLHSFDGRDLPAELEELHVRVAGVEGEHATEVVEPLALARGAHLWCLCHSRGPGPPCLSLFFVLYSC
jgi:hypothetical protein